MFVDHAGILRQALECNGSGIIVESNHPKLLQAQLYKFKKDKPEYEGIAIRISRVNPSQLWIINNEKK